MKVIVRFLLVGAASLWANAAHADCTAGQQMACACPGGKSGVQVCADDGKRFGACACEALAEKTAPEMMERKSTPMFATGIALLVFGGLAIPGGLGIIVASQGSSSSTIRNDWEVAGGTFIGLGVASAIAGTVLVILGGPKVPRASAKVTWMPALRLDAPGAVAGASAEWRF